MSDRYTENPYSELEYIPISEIDRLIKFCSENLDFPTLYRFILIHGLIDEEPLYINLGKYGNPSLISSLQHKIGPFTKDKYAHMLCGAFINCNPQMIKLCVKNVKISDETQYDKYIIQNDHTNLSIILAILDKHSTIPKSLRQVLKNKGYKWKKGKLVIGNL